VQAAIREPKPERESDDRGQHECCSKEEDFSTYHEVQPLPLPFPRGKRKPGIAMKRELFSGNWPGFRESVVGQRRPSAQPAKTGSSP
jgi:hypothetical protein